MRRWSGVDCRNQSDASSIEPVFVEHFRKAFFAAVDYSVDNNNDKLN